MFEDRDHSFAHFLVQSFKRELEYRYEGSERGFTEGLSFAITRSLTRGTQPTEESCASIARELVRRGWTTNLAEAISQGLWTAVVGNNYAPLMSHLEAESEKGSVAAKLSFGLLNAEGLAGVPQSLQAAVQLFRQAAGTCDQGNPCAQYNLGVLYYFGSGVEKSHEQAAHWFACAAAQGHPGAQFNLGSMYYFGQGVAQSLARAVVFFQQSAVQGEAIAQYNLGMCYFLGNGIAQDLDSAINWLRLAADQQQGDAQCQLGLIYLRGIGVSPDPQHAAHWLSLSANQGVVDAQSALGTMFQQGLGVRQSLEQATRYWLAAALQEHGGAQYNLGLLSENQEHYDDACVWYQKALENGFIEAGFRLEQLRESIEKMVKAGPDSSETVVNFDEMIEIAVGQENWDKVIAVCSTVLQGDPRNVISLRNRALGYYQKKMYDRSITDCTAALEIDENDAATLRQRGRAYRRMELPMEASVDFTRAIDLDPQNAETYAYRADAYLMVGAKKTKQRGPQFGFYYTMAIADCSKAIALAPDYDFAYFVRGLCHHEKRAFSPAIADYRKALELGFMAPDAINDFIASALRKEMIN